MIDDSDLQRGGDWPLAAATLGFLTVLVGGPFLAFSYLFSHGELGAKPFYAALQGVEYENRSNKDPTPILRANVAGEGLDVVGVRGRDAAKTRVWIILNKVDSDGNPFLLPAGIDLDADCSQLERVIKGENVEAAVRSFLFRGCESGGASQPDKPRVLP
jgi:hypothetical protein